MDCILKKTSETPQKYIKNVINSMLALTPTELPQNILIAEKTLARECYFEGIGVHSGKQVCLSIKPTLKKSGIYFVRTDVLDSYNIIRARFENVTNTCMSTTITNNDGISVSTIEHIIAALAGVGITNARIEIDGPEVPIMDGSSYVFSKKFNEIGVCDQHSYLDNFIIENTIRVENEYGFAEFVPHDSRIFDVSFDFGGRLASLTYSFDLDHDCFYALLSDARTFGLYEDGMKVKAMGLAQGASLDNTIVFKDMTVMNEGGLRSNDELVRHKMLDAIGDIYLAGFPIIGKYRAHNPSHTLNNQLLRAVFKNHEF